MSLKPLVAQNCICGQPCLPRRPVCIECWYSAPEDVRFKFTVGRPGSKTALLAHARERLQKAYPGSETLTHVRD